MDRLDAIRVFVRVVECRSFSAVARELGVGQPTVSKQIAALERHLGAQLLLRTSRAVTLTDAGRDYFESSSRLLQELEAAESRIGRGLQAPSGHVRVSVAPSFGALYLVPRLLEFSRRFPDISLEILASDRTTHLVEEGIDVAIRNGELADSSLIARRVGSVPIVVVASTQYLRAEGEPAKPSDLAKHRCIIFSPKTGPRAWTFVGRNGPVSYMPEGRFMTNEGEQIRAAVLAGLGIAQVPHWLVSQELSAGTVLRILRKYEPPAVPISTVRPANRRLASKVSVFIDFVAETLAQVRPPP
jgi:DNA-binding transcriptional LysR family regulator